VDAFKLKAEEHRIKNLTTKSSLLKVIYNNYSKADPYYRLHDYITYTQHTPLSVIVNRLQQLHLFKLAKERFLELDYKLNTVPKYMNNTNINVHVTMTLQEAHDWFKDNKPKG